MNHAPCWSLSWRLSVPALILSSPTLPKTRRVCSTDDVLHGHPESLRFPAQTSSGGHDRELRRAPSWPSHTPTHRGQNGATVARNRACSDVLSPSGEGAGSSRRSSLSDQSRRK